MKYCKPPSNLLCSRRKTAQEEGTSAVDGSGAQGRRPIQDIQILTDSQVRRIS